jgi:hypothetical protein
MPDSFRVEAPDDERLHRHHRGEEAERDRAGMRGQHREDQGDRERHDPVREAPEALASGTRHVREDLAEIDPDHSALREREERDEGDQQPEQEVLVLLGGRATVMKLN